MPDCYFSFTPLSPTALPLAGSYVALTVQGRPPGSPQIPLAESEVDPPAAGHMSPLLTSPHSPGASGNMDRITNPVLVGVRPPCPGGPLMPGFYVLI